MPRQNIYPNPAVKLFEAYVDFSGGLNSEFSNERLKDNELVTMDNVDMLGRGSLKRRTGRTLVASQSGTAQGMFFFYNQGATNPDTIVAISGKLYVIPNGATSMTNIPITDGGNAFTFQATLPVEAVMYGTTMYVATGTKLVQVTYSNGTYTAVTVTPYSVTPQEAIYIGTNALAPNPNAYIQDGTATTLTLVGIAPQTPTGVVNTANQMTAYVNKPASITSVQYTWSYKKSTDTNWTQALQANDASGKTWTPGFTPDTATNYDIMVKVADNTSGTPSTTVTATYSLTQFVVNETVNKSKNNPPPCDDIQTCRKILLHWDRIILSGSSKYPYQIYISDLENPAYFPTGNTLGFDGGKQEPITAMVRYKDLLVVFTSSTTQILQGHAPSDYVKVLVHDSLGCIAPRSAKVVMNSIIFLSAEGVQQFVPNLWILTQLQLERVDYQIKSAVVQDTNACGMWYNDQYWLCLPSQSLIYRYYYDQKIWVRDKSSKLNFAQFLRYENDVLNLSQDGNVYSHDTTGTVFTDNGEVYNMVCETKYYDVEASFNYKKLKRLYVLAKHYTDHNVDLQVQVLADSTMALTPTTGQATVNADHTTTWKTTITPNMNFEQGATMGAWTLGTSQVPNGDGLTTHAVSHPLGVTNQSVQIAHVRGKCRRIKVIFTHSEASLCEIFGLGLEFKLKKPY